MNHQLVVNHNHKVSVPDYDDESRAAFGRLNLDTQCVRAKGTVLIHPRTYTNSR